MLKDDYSQILDSIFYCKKANTLSAPKPVSYKNLRAVSIKGKCVGCFGVMFRLSGQKTLRRLRRVSGVKGRLASSEVQQIRNPNTALLANAPVVSSHDTCDQSIDICVDSTGYHIT